MILVITNRRNKHVRPMKTLNLTLITIRTTLSLFRFNLANETRVLYQEQTPRRRTRTNTIISLSTDQTKRAMATTATRLATRLLPVINSSHERLYIRPKQIVGMKRRLIRFLFPLGTPSKRGTLRLHFGNVNNNTINGRATKRALRNSGTRLILFTRLRRLRLLLAKGVTRQGLRNLMRTTLGNFLNRKRTIINSTSISSRPLFLNLRHNLMRTKTIAKLKTRKQIIRLMSIRVINTRVIRKNIRILPRLLHILNNNLNNSMSLKTSTIGNFTRLRLTINMNTNNVGRTSAHLMDLTNRGSHILLKGTLSKRDAGTIFIRNSTNTPRYSRVRERPPIFSGGALYTRCGAGYPAERRGPSPSGHNDTRQ